MIGLRNGRSRRRRRVIVIGAAALAALALAACDRGMTWNVNGVSGKVGDPVPNWGAVIANQGAPSVIGLQEICRADAQNLTNRLNAAGYGYRLVFFRTHLAGTTWGECGNAMLSRLTVYDVQCRYISPATPVDCGAEPGNPPATCTQPTGPVVVHDCRLVMSFMVRAPDGNGGDVPVRVYNSHTTAGGEYGTNNLLKAREAARQVTAVADETTRSGIARKFVFGDFQWRSFTEPYPETGQSPFARFRDLGFQNVSTGDTTPYTQPSGGCPGSQATVKPDYMLAFGDVPWKAPVAPCVESTTSDHNPMWTDIVR